MKILKIFILGLLFSFNLTTINAQTEAVNSEAIGDDWSFTVQGNATNVVGTNPYTLTVNALPNLTGIGTFTLQNAQVGDILFSANNGIYEVLSTNGAAQPVMTINLLNDPIQLGFVLPPSGQLVISRPHGACGTVANYVGDGGTASGISFPLEYLIDSYNQQRQANCIEEGRVTMSDGLPTNTPDANQSHVQLDTTSNQLAIYNETLDTWEYLSVGSDAKANIANVIGAVNLDTDFVDFEDFEARFYTAADGDISFSAGSPIAVVENGVTTPGVTQPVIITQGQSVRVFKYILGYEVVIVSDLNTDIDPLNEIQTANEVNVTSGTYNSQTVQQALETIGTAANTADGDGDSTNELQNWGNLPGKPTFATGFENADNYTLLASASEDWNNYNTPATGKVILRGSAVNGPTPGISSFYFVNVFAIQAGGVSLVQYANGRENNFVYRRFAINNSWSKWKQIGGDGLASSAGGSPDWNTLQDYGWSEKFYNGNGVNGPGTGLFYLYIKSLGNSTFRQEATSINSSVSKFRYSFNGVLSDWEEEYNSGNDGSGSGLDADLLDGLNSTAFLDSKFTYNTTLDRLIANTGIGLQAGRLFTSSPQTFTTSERIAVLGLNGEIGERLLSTIQDNMGDCEATQDVEMNNNLILNPQGILFADNNGDGEIWVQGENATTGTFAIGIADSSDYLFVKDTVFIESADRVLRYRDVKYFRDTVQIRENFYSRTNSNIVGISGSYLQFSERDSKYTIAKSVYKTFSPSSQNTDYRIEQINTLGLSTGLSVDFTLLANTNSVEFTLPATIEEGYSLVLQVLDTNSTSQTAKGGTLFLTITK